MRPQRTLLSKWVKGGRGRFKAYQFHSFTQRGSDFAFAVFLYELQKKKKKKIKEGQKRKRDKKGKEKDRKKKYT